MKDYVKIRNKIQFLITNRFFNEKQGILGKN